jgi:hypothetical protein
MTVVCRVHLFPAGRQLPRLLNFRALNRERGPPALDSEDIMSLVRCCPALTDVNMPAARGASLAPLTSLTALSRLSFGCSKDTATDGHLAALTQLQHLDFTVVWTPDNDFGEETPYGLQHLVPLTALTGLTELSSCVYNEENEEEPQDVLVYARNQVSLIGTVRLWARRPAYCSALGCLPQALRLWFSALTLQRRIGWLVWHGLAGCKGAGEAYVHVVSSVQPSFGFGRNT